MNSHKNNNQGINLTQNDSEIGNNQRNYIMQFNNTYNDLRIININPIMINNGRP